MSLADLLALSADNLRRMKLRTTLTVSGVAIAIGALVAMLSFGVGNQQYVSQQFEELGLLHTMQVYARESGASADTTAPRTLDAAALAELSRLPGVRLAYPYDSFTVTVACGDSQRTTEAQALPTQVLGTKYFSKFAAGSAFATDDAPEALVTRRFLHEFGIVHPEEAVGRSLALRVSVASVDSGLARVGRPDRDYIARRVKEVQFDSLGYRDYAERLMQEELRQGTSRFLEGFLEARATLTDTLVIRGVLESGASAERGLAPILVPLAKARRLSSGLRPDDPAALMAALRSGQLFQPGSEEGRSFPRATLDLDPRADQAALSDSIRALGFRPFSFAEQFAEMRKFFFFFDLGLAALGAIALVTASLGIINTLVMSVLERRREIGVLKSLGADERDIRLLFLTESGVIGAVGAVLGLLLGWAVSRVASAVAQAVMARQGFSGIDLFAMPPWLAAVGLAVGIVVSLVAGLYPAARAARVDPVEALRNE